MTAEQLSATAGVILSLVFSYVPPVRGWFEALDGDGKRVVMGLALAVVAAGALGLSCLDWSALVQGAPLPTCDEVGVGQALQALLAALIANQAVFLISPQPNKGRVRQGRAG